MFCDKSYFVSYSASSGQTISVGDARNVPVEGLGSVRLRVRLPEGQRTVTLHKVMHAPKLSMNLVSLGALQREGAQYRSTETGLVVTLGKDELMHGQLKEGLYRVECIDGSTEAAFATSSGASMRTWHRRMGHLHLEGIRELARKGMVHGLTISSSDHDRVCEGCAIGKSHRLPLPKMSQTRYERMDLIVADLTGPMKIETWSGKRYALVAVEVSSRYGIVRLLKSKDEAPATLKEIIVMLERQPGQKLKKLRTDNGTELVNDKVEDLCKRNGIIHEMMVPYGPEQNRIAE